MRNSLFQLKHSLNQVFFFNSVARMPAVELRGDVLVLNFCWETFSKPTSTVFYTCSFACAFNAQLG